MLAIATATNDHANGNVYGVKFYTPIEGTQFYDNTKPYIYIPCVSYEHAQEIANAHNRHVPK